MGNIKGLQINVIKIKRTQDQVVNKTHQNKIN